MAVSLIPLRRVWLIRVCLQVLGAHVGDSMSEVSGYAAPPAACSLHGLLSAPATPQPSKDIQFICTALQIPLPSFSRDCSRVDVNRRFVERRSALYRTVNAAWALAQRSLAGDTVISDDAPPSAAAVGPSAGAQAALTGTHPAFVLHLQMCVVFGCCGIV